MRRGLRIGALVVLVPLVVVGAVAWVWPYGVGQPLLNMVGPHLWRWVAPYMKTFDPSPNRDVTISGSPPLAVCQNTHVDWGEQVRRNQSLDGVWAVGEGALSDQPPERFDRRAAVPGLLSEAEPPYDDVGVESERREAFWYRTSFVALEDASDRAYLCLEKAKYGVKVWLNGMALGEHFGAYTASEYDLADAIRYGESNELLIRVGADPSRVPEFLPLGADSEKYRWYPGLWDSVAVVYTGPFSIVRTKAEADLERGVVRLRTVIRNSSVQSARLEVRQAVGTWPGGVSSSETVSGEIDVPAGEARELAQEITISDVRPWSPETPALYLARTTLLRDGTASDDRATRFGMREVAWKGGADKGFFLNGRRYYLRGTNIAFHRFLEDQDRRGLPWDAAWVRQLLGGHPKEIGWNSLRFHIGRAPNDWYDVADEVGLIVADEFNAFGPMSVSPMAVWSLAEMQKEYTGWVQENWNHPSIGWWDASNETNSPLPYDVVPLVRGIDETRQWESGSYRAPDRADDPMEEHPYLMNGVTFMNTNPKTYTLEDLDDVPDATPFKPGDGVFSSWSGPQNVSHAYVNNEYGWLWLTRDGSKPTPLTGGAYANLGALDATPEERLELYAYMVSELTALWRSRRGYVGVQHFLYLGKCTDPDTVRDEFEPKDASMTCDNFVDVPNLVLEERWRRYARDAFAPVAVYLERWSDEFYLRGQRVGVPLTLINDEYEPVNGTVRLVARTAEGETLAESETQLVVIPALGRVEESVLLDVPTDTAFVLYAELDVPGRARAHSRRKLGFAHPGALIQP